MTTIQSWRTNKSKDWGFFSFFNQTISFRIFLDEAHRAQNPMAVVGDDIWILDHDMGSSLFETSSDDVLSSKDSDSSSEDSETTTAAAWTAL